MSDNEYYGILKYQDKEASRQDVVDFFDIGDDARSERFEMMSVMSFGEQRGELEGRIRDYIDRERADRERVAGIVDQQASSSTDTIHHRLVRESGVGSVPVETPVPAVGRPRDTSDYSTMDVDDMSFQNIENLFRSAIRNNEVSNDTLEIFEEVAEDRRLNKRPNRETLELIRSIFKKRVSRHKSNT